MPDHIIDEITADLQQRIKQYQSKYTVENIGTVIEAGDGIATVEGLADVHSQEMVVFENGLKGIAFSLKEKTVGVIILGDYASISEGMLVRSTGNVASVPVGDELIGRVINAIGSPIDGKGPISSEKIRQIERVAPGVIKRQDVDSPVQTGLKAIDAMIPIGRGQRELIIGDRQTGKTALAIDTIINQHGKDLICIYVAIGQKKAAIARTVGLLERFGAMEHTIVVMAASDESAAMQYIAPYAACAIGEEFMEDGRDALVVYDDLSKHAWAYREISLLLRRPPGREAYPGDVFYLHSRLLERAAQLANNYIIIKSSSPNSEGSLKESIDGKVFSGPMAFHDAEAALNDLPKNEEYKIVKVRGTGGSLTALPIIETLLGDVSAYIPTNVISITDGQIYLEGNLFNAGIRPAVNIGISVSRVGGSAQTKAMKQVASRLRLDMAAYNELAAFAQFGSDLDKSTQAQLSRGQRLQEILKQPQYEPMSLENQVIVLFAGTNGYADTIPVEKIKAWELALLRYVDINHSDIKEEIATQKRISSDLESKLRDVMQVFNSANEF